jgi:hypothetical protein
MGLHRQTAALERLGFDVEMRKRLFWSCYTMDRQVWSIEKTHVTVYYLHTSLTII